MGHGNHPVVMLAGIAGRGRTDRILMIERMTLTDQALRSEDSLIIPAAADSPRSVSARRIEDFFVAATGAKGFYICDSAIPSQPRQWKLAGEYLEKSSLLDLRILMAVLFPSLTCSSIRDFGRAFTIPETAEPKERLERLLDIAAARTVGLPRGLQRQLKVLAGQASSGLSDWFAGARLSPYERDFTVDESCLTNLDRFENLTEGESLSCTEISELLKDEQMGGRYLEGFELRPGQARYATAVGRALESGQVLLIEGATGTGKSIGYLLPLVSTAHERHARAVIVTRTKSLQEQLFKSDLRKVRKLIPPGFKVAVLKGLSNYLCLLKFKSHLATPDFTLDPEGARRLMSLLVWEQETKSGDLTETDLFTSPEAAGLQSRVTLDESGCLGAACVHYSACYAFRARKQAVKADLVITNYALLFADLFAGRSILGRCSFAVFDEAHRMEGEATKAFTIRLPLLMFARILEQIGSGRFAALLKDIFTGHEEKHSDMVKLPAGAESLPQSVVLLAENIRSAISRPQESSADRVRFHAGDEIHDRVRSHWQTNADNYFALRDWLVDLQEGLAASTETGGTSELTDIRRRIGTVVELIGSLERLDKTTDLESVMWIEQGASGEVTLTAAPADVGSLLALRLYPGYESVVMTSATLESAGNFDWISRQLGVTEEQDIHATRLKLGSPFPLSEQLHVALAGYLPFPDSERYPARLAQLIAKLRRSTPLSTLVLCTSYRMIDSLATSLKKQGNLPGEILVQQPDVAPASLLSRLQRNENAMLIGTESFWEGVDLPDELLRLMVLTRLPFPVPDDPLELAKGERAQARGESPFVTVSLPAAVLKYRQALGRVIRGLSDWGAVVITDSRMARKNYGSFFMSAALAEVQIFEQESLLLKKTGEWLRERQGRFK